MKRKPRGRPRLRSANNYYIYIYIYIYIYTYACVCVCMCVCVIWNMKKKTQQKKTKKKKEQTKKQEIQRVRIFALYASFNISFFFTISRTKLPCDITSRPKNNFQMKKMKQKWNEKNSFLLSLRAFCFKMYAT